MSPPSPPYCLKIPLALEDPDFTSPWEYGIPEEFIGYGKDPKRLHKVKLEGLYTQPESENYKGSGHLLLKAIEEQYRDRFDGRIVLEATRSSHVFYYIHGFRAVENTKNREIESALQTSDAKKKPNTSHLRSVIMYLPDETGKEWSQRSPLTKPNDLFAYRQKVQNRGKKLNRT